MFREYRDEYYQRAAESFNTIYRKLPSGLYQGVVIPKIAMPLGNESSEPTGDFMVIAENEKAIIELFYKHLEEKSEIPLHPSWIQWLWSTFLENGWLTPLICKVGTIQGYLVEVFEDELKDKIIEAIALKTPEIIKCFDKGG